MVVIERRAVRRRRPLTEGDLSWIRSTARWKRLVDEICVPGAVCGICLGERGPILFDVRRAHPLSRSLDHIKPLARGGDPWDPANLQPAHLSCNAAKGDREPPARCNRGWSWY
ncbi:HNH endonuclease [Cellulomonas uda]|uniref:HNH endonuclease n=1 Tax=Cellulomonas uda TaxID=1714 RepID=UPI00141BC957|nr:5-methylcytosine-specific restriction endonuclease McrA [Cellulomonas uda]